MYELKNKRFLGHTFLSIVLYTEHNYSRFDSRLPHILANNFTYRTKYVFIHHIFLRKELKRKNRRTGKGWLYYIAYITNDDYDDYLITCKIFWIRWTLPAVSLSNLQNNTAPFTNAICSTRSIIGREYVILKIAPCHQP